jgi:hypothetical protein
MSNIFRFLQELIKGLVYAIGFVILLGFLSFLGFLSVPVLISYFAFRFLKDLLLKERKNKVKTINGWLIDEYNN